MFVKFSSTSKWSAKSKVNVISYLSAVFSVERFLKRIRLNLDFVDICGFHSTRGHRTLKDLRVNPLLHALRSLLSIILKFSFSIKPNRQSISLCGVRYVKRIGDLSSEHLSQYADVRRFNKLDNIIRNNCNVQLKMVIISSLLKQKML